MAKKTIKLGIVGMRDYDDYDFFCQKMDQLLSKPEFDGFHVILYSGEASGVDDMVEDYVHHHCQREDVTFKGIPADWDTHGKSAGFIRNAEIVNQVSRIYAFWDRKTKGTKDTVTRALSARKPVKIFLVQPTAKRYYCKRKRDQWNKDE